MSQKVHEDSGLVLYQGDCLDVMRSIPDNFVDSIVTDPPYGLGFMGKAWDALPPGEEWARECLRILKPGGHVLAFGGTRTWHRLAVAVEDAGFEIRDSIAWMYGSGFPKHRAALKPAFEPIVMGRKPFKGSLTTNEAEHGTGALDIDGCRIRTGESLVRPSVSRYDNTVLGNGLGAGVQEEPSGRWPANVILDEDMAETLDQQSETTVSRVGKPKGATFGDGWGMTATGAEYSDKGGASRFFYVAKAPKKERPVVDGVAHPTVKPVALMQWLVKLVTPAGGIVLDPFEGSGTTAQACELEGFKHIGIERESEYLPLIAARLGITFNLQAI